MANWNFYYNYEIPPNQQYQGFGDELYELHPEAFVYIPIIYNVQYTGVTSFEYNGTTYYNYEVYETPVLSYSIEANVVNNTNVVNEDEYGFSAEIAAENFNTSVVTEVEYDFTADVTVENYSTCIVSENDYDYSVENNNDYYNSNMMMETVEDGINNYYYQQSSFNYYSDYSHVSAVTYSDSSCIATELNRSLINASSTDTVETIPTSTENLSSCFSSSDETPEISNQNDETPVINNQNDETPEISNQNEETPEISNQNDTVCPCSQIDYNIAVMKTEGAEIENTDKDDNNTLVMNTKVDDNKRHESNVIENLVDKSDSPEDSEEETFVYEENVFDWTIDVEENDLKEEQNDDSFEVNFSPFNDMQQKYSAEDVKYFKESLYLKALSGYLSEKERLPVVHILPTIDEESESIDEDDGSELDKGDSEFPLKDRKSITFNDESLASGEEFEISEDDVLNFVEAENVFQAESHTPNYEKENQLKYQNNCIKSGTTEVQLICQNTDAQLTPSKETDIRKDETEATHVISSCLKNDAMLRPSEEVQIRKNEIAATQIKSMSGKNDSLIITNEDLRKELILHEFESNSAMTCHVRQEMEPHVQCCSERKVENQAEGETKVSSKTKKKKFGRLRKFLGNLCCCARKKT